MTIDFKIIITQPKVAGDESRGAHQVTVDADGKDSQKATWETLSVWFTTCDPKMTSDKLCEMIQAYDGEISKPIKCWIRDDISTSKNKPKPFRPFKQFGWKPTRILVKPKTIKILENETEETVIWEDKNLSKNKRITSKLCRYGTKQPVGGSVFTPMISCWMEEDIFPSETCCFVSDGTKPGATMSVDWMLKNANVSPSCNKVQAIKHKIKARVSYKVTLTGTISADYGCESSKGNPYRNYPIDAVLKYNGMNPSIMIHEDIELQCFTNIHPSKE